MGKKMCIGTFLNILSQARSTVLSQENQFQDLLSIINDQRRFDKSYHGALKSGKNNLSDASHLMSCDTDRLVGEFERKVVTYIVEANKHQVILAFKDVLEDDDIADTTIIGFDSDYTKGKILSSIKFNFAETLANVFYYCGTQTDNRACVDSIKLIKDKNYIHSFDDKVSTIILEVARDTTTIPLTTNSRNFDLIFEEVGHHKLELPNDNELKSFILDIVGNEFDYSNIQKFIRTNIGRYVFSRSQRNNYEVNGNIESLSADAIAAYKKRLEKNSSTTQFNEIMLYLFLEAILGAPKIYSKMELQSLSGIYESASAGIHLLLTKNGTTTTSQLVFGATDTIDNLQSSIDSAFLQIEKIRNQKTDEYNLVESTIMNIIPDYKNAQSLRDIIIPQRASVKKPDQAFGLFLGYTIDIPNKENMTRDAYKNAVKIKMEQDITNLTPYIIVKITQLGITAHSFYIYVLPLNNVNIDKEEIMKKALEV